MSNPTDWLKICWELSKIPLWNTDLRMAEENIMNSLITELSNLLKKESKKESMIIWTLHEVIGDQQRFYRSSRRERNDGNKERKITEGLIGRAIRDDNIVSIFPYVKDYEEYLEGWPECQSELIILIKDHNKTIGVINIESDQDHDFFTDTNCIDENTKQLQIFCKLVSNHISIIFKNKKANEKNWLSYNLINKVTSSVSSNAKLGSAIEAAFNYLIESIDRIQYALFYVSNPSNENNFLLRTECRGKGFNSKKLAKKQITWKYHEFFDDTLATIKDRSKISGFFDEEISDADVFFMGSNLDQQLVKIKFFVIILMSNKTGTQSNHADEEEQIKNNFDIIKQITFRFLRNISTLNSNKLKALIMNMYQTVLKENDFRTALNRIAAYISDDTESTVCLIYLVTPEHHHYSRHKFYLGGTNRDRENNEFLNIRIDHEAKFISKAFKEKRPNYHSNFFDSEDRDTNLNDYLEGQNLKEPEAFAIPFYLKNTDIGIGAVLLFREKQSSSPRYEYTPHSANQIITMSEEWAEHLSEIISTEKEKQASQILAITYKELASFIPTFSDYSSIDDLICFLQKIITEKILQLSLWDGMLSPAYFVTYKFDGAKLHMLGRDSLIPKNVDIDPPTFGYGIGLTGAVLNHDELYEPFIEDVKRIKAANLDYPLPDDICKNFWMLFCKIGEECILESM